MHHVSFLIGAMSISSAASHGDISRLNLGIQPTLSEYLSHTVSFDRTPPRTLPSAASTQATMLAKGRGMTVTGLGLPPAPCLRRPRPECPSGIILFSDRGFAP